MQTIIRLSVALYFGTILVFTVRPVLSQMTENGNECSLSLLTGVPVVGSCNCEENPFTDEAACISDGCGGSAQLQIIRQGSCGSLENGGNCHSWEEEIDLPTYNSGCNDALLPEEGCWSGSGCDCEFTEDTQTEPGSADATHASGGAPCDFV